MARGITFDTSSAKRIARSVRRTEGDYREMFGSRRVAGHILNALQTYWGTLDADLAYNNTTGVVFSIWWLNDSNVWADSGDNIDLVFPPFELAHALVPSGVKVAVTNHGGKWCVSEFPKVYEGTLAGALAVSGSATVTVGGDSFTGCKGPNTQEAEIPTSSAVTITLESDGYYHVTLAPC